MTNFEQAAPAAHEHLNAVQREQWSALHDGELSSQEALALVRASLSDESLMQQWRSMSAVGQVLREAGAQPSWRKPSLASEQSAQEMPSANAVQQLPVQTAANETRWKMVAGIAAICAVGSLVWGLLGASGGNGLQGGQVLAGDGNGPSKVLASTSTGQAQSLTGALEERQVAGQEFQMIRNPRLDEFLAAHRQFGGVSALQQPAGSLRSVSVSSQHP
jgi:sigma-E factor negative regulatory protein RseA